MKKFTLYIMSALLACSALAFDSTEKQIAIANEVVPQMIQEGVLRVDKGACKAWISPMLWMQFDATGKADAAAAIAVYCSARDPVIEIYDSQSARRLARWGWARGLEVF
jgi:uncharacterized protein YaaW (UPF0174 family)